MTPPLAFASDIASLIPILFVVFIVVAIVVAVMQSGREKKRSLALRGWAEHRRFHFLPKSEGNDSTFDERFPAFDCMRNGDQRYAYNIANGAMGDTEVVAFDYHYRTRSTDSKGRTQYHHHNFSAVLLDTRLALKPLFIRAEGFFDKITSAFGFDDIDFESAEFSRTFFVKSPDRKWAYDVIHQETMEFLLRAPRFTIQLAGPHALIWRGRRFSAAEFDHALNVITGILDRIPKDIRKELAF
ncbi:MAG: hypothetical protein QNJ98_14355 [Planctomycetota bacterium]|nr:hypothetical protein [Planctomycetota bacterium]